MVCISFISLHIICTNTDVDMVVFVYESGSFFVHISRITVNCASDKRTGAGND